jgi:hypothetical protein
VRLHVHDGLDGELLLDLGGISAMAHLDASPYVLEVAGVFGIEVRRGLDCGHDESSKECFARDFQSFSNQRTMEMLVSEM